MCSFEELVIHSQQLKAKSQELSILNQEIIFQSRELIALNHKTIAQSQELRFWSKEFRVLRAKINALKTANK